tara:strand:- start:4460 stop:5293 length:834 start_codon:yes stop_codon:yes gene_type:complete
MSRGRKLERLEDYKRALRNKYGLGEGSHYKPWLRVQDVKSRGTSSKIQGIKSSREHHTLSKNETQFFYIAEFSNTVIDIREQFPLIPLDLSLKISKAIGIQHPRVPGTGELSVLTTDFLVTRFSNGKTWYEAYNVKPEDELNRLRVLEKIDIERIWWELLGVSFYEFAPSELTKTQSNNISWASDPVRHSVKKISEIDYRNFKLASQSLTPGQFFQEDICQKLLLIPELSEHDPLNILKILIAEKLITVDLTQPLVTSGLIKILSIDNNFRIVANGS